LDLGPMPYTDLVREHVEEAMGQSLWPSTVISSEVASRQRSSSMPATSYWDRMWKRCWRYHLYIGSHSPQHGLTSREELLVGNPLLYVVAVATRAIL
jgi:hypothetical protein